MNEGVAWPARFGTRSALVEHRRSNTRIVNETLQSLVLDLPRRGSRPALKLRTDYRTFAWSYAELSRRIRAIGHWYTRKNLSVGDRVVFWASNSPTWAAAYLAALAAGIVPAPLDLHSAPDFVERVVEETKARLILVGRFQPMLKGPLPSHTLEDLEWESRPGQTERETWPEITSSDLAEILYTSGTTARPRGVMLTHGNIMANLDGIQPVVPREPYYRFVSLLPLSHAFEQVIGLLLPLSRAGEVTYLQTLKPSAIEEALQRVRPNALVVVPQFLDLLRGRIESRWPGQGRGLNAAAAIARMLPMRPRRALLWPVRNRLGGDLRYVVCGGAPLDVALEKFWDSLGVLVLQGYGLTEAAPVVTANTPRARHIGSVGKPLFNVQVRIGQDGEVLVRGPNVMLGYYDHPELTEAAFVDGWLRTGDLGEIDRDGFLYIRGRQKDLIVTTAGLKVYPEDVEEVLNRQPGVRDSAVLEWNGQVHAVLLLDPARALPPEVIVQRANLVLNPVERIHGWTLWPGADFPRTPTLKVQKYRVREALAANIAQPVPRTRPPGRVERIIADLAPTREVYPAARLGLDLDLSSIDRLELITLLEEEFHVDLPEVNVSGETTVAEMVQLVKQAKPQERWHPRCWPLRLPVIAVRLLLQDALIFPVLRQVLRLQVDGIDVFKRLNGPFILAGNHVSNLDGVAVLMTLPYRVRTRTAIAALAGFYFPPSTNPLENAFHQALFDLASLCFNVFPVPRASGFRESLRYTGFLAEHGWNILIFPEGTRSPSGKTQPFREGIGLLASELRIPIVPFYIDGTYTVLPRGSWIPRPGPVRIRFGDPLLFPVLTPWEITRRVERAVAALAPVSAQKVGS